MQTIFAAALFVGTLFFGLDAVAETPATIIAVVDVQKIVHDSTAGKSLQVQYDKEREIFGDRVAKLESDLDTREQELNRQRTVLTQDAFNEQRQALESKAAEVQQTIQQQSQANQMAFNDAFAELVNNVRGIVSAVAKEKNVTIVLSQEQILYLGEGAINITETVLSRLNTKLPSITVAIPPSNNTKIDAVAVAPPKTSKP